MDIDQTTNILHSGNRPGNFQGVMGNGNGSGSGNSDLIVTIFDGNNAPVNIRLFDFGKTVISFGRAPGNDIVLTSPLVSSEHGRFSYVNGQWSMEDREFYGSSPSTNGLIYNNAAIVRRSLCEGDFIRIDDGVETIAEGVLFVFAAADSRSRWNTVMLQGQNQITLGRDPGCSIVLPHISVSKLHARIVSAGGHYFIEDNNSTNGVIVNNRRITGKQVLHEKDVIMITNTKLIFTSQMISYCFYGGGISVDAENVVIRRGKGKKSFVTCNNVSLNIKPGELIAIIGGSGAGKSTILNAMSGYLHPAAGHVYINGAELYQNFDSLKKLIGYVPQSDIVYDNLTLYDMLLYTSKLRLPPDTSQKEREAAIDRAIRLVELTEKKNSFIKALSGGQKKRASIAVELLSDPNLLFLDEPASGLDPGTERSLMTSLREMADGGKTVILVTHSTLQLKMCDKIVFMGKGGNLCFFGPHDEALDFFGVSDVVDVYGMITDHAKEIRQKYDATLAAAPQGKTRTEQAAVVSTKREKKARQLPVLCQRYLKLVVNDRQRLILLMLQAPLLAILISLVADGKQYDQYEMTKSLLFSLSCCAFWVGMLNAIQEVCKERNILRREYMTGLSLTNYIISKVVVLGLMCLIQSAMIVGVFSLTVGLPKGGVFTSPFVEIFLTTFLTAISASAMGLFVSSLFTNADRAMTVAPILLMPQILFSGMMFSLAGATEIISYITNCRWSMEAYGTTANLNGLELSLQQLDPFIAQYVSHNPEDCFEFVSKHLFTDWGILLLFVIGYLVIARVVLQSVGKENG
ncbi:MAG: ATP-binding cassette domain-containing protein [Lachnospiraceae bacterium]|nr:ATP-binding cassette domain-containing protein [Lachnospiraceae bacterium]